MQKTTLLLVISLVLFSCGKKSQDSQSTANASQEKTSLTDNSKIGRSNFAVIWDTPDAELVGKFAEEIIGEFTELWKKDIIENAYFNSDSVESTEGKFPNIAFFLKAHSKQEAHEILNELTIVSKGAATYKIHPVGMQWLKRNTDAIKKTGISKTFVSIWTNTNEKPNDEVLKAQNDKILELWNAGEVENVYLDIENMQKENDRTDFVLFVNRNSQEEAEELCNSFPIYKAGMAHYKIVPVGVFWYGNFEDQ